MGDSAEDEAKPDTKNTKKKKKAAPSKQKKKAASSKEITNILDEGKLVAKSLQFGNSSSISLSGNLSIDVATASNSKKKGSMKASSINKEGTDKAGNYTTNVSLSNGNVRTSTETDTTSTSSSGGRTSSTPIVAEVSKETTANTVNPWLRDTSDGENNDDDQDNAG